ncbi:hypothetical protein [Embleya sp. NPDC005971]|uniref:hypothetical protein n=1 Tax=Embleya sp. NPDC005971 TaxID=3156724 RepID=UPI0033F4A465
MSVEIASHIPGRTVHPYELLDEMRKYVGSDREAHDSIHVFLNQIVEIDGEENVILSTRPIRPELLESNPQDLDVYHWITISDDAAQDIRDAFAAAYSGTEDNETSNAVFYQIEVSDDGTTWMPENDDARGTEDTEGETPRDVAQAILVNRITDLASENLTPGHMRVRVWADEDSAIAGLDALAEVTHA